MIPSNAAMPRWRSAMANARRGGNALRDIIAFSQRYGIPRRHAGYRTAETITNYPNVGNNWISKPRKCGQLAAGLVGLADLLLK